MYAVIKTGGKQYRVEEGDTLAIERANWGFFRDRRPELYQVLLTADGKTPV